jgi:hypothetical protein
MYAISRTTVKGKKQTCVVEFVPQLKTDGTPRLSVDRGTKLTWVVGSVPESKRDWFALPHLVFATKEEAVNALPKAEQDYAIYDSTKPVKAAKAEPVQEVAAQDQPTEGHCPIGAPSA